MVEKASIFSPLTLTQMRLSRGMINRFMTENGAIINNLVHIFRPSHKLKLHDEIICYLPYSFLLEQYHKRIAMLFIDTLRENKQSQPISPGEEDDDMKLSDSESDDDDDGDENKDDEGSSKQHIQGDTGLKVYDIEREVDRIDASLNDDVQTEGEEDEEEEYNQGEEEEDEHKKVLEEMMMKTPRTVTNQHVFEWLQLIGQQIVPSEKLMTKTKIYTKEDIVLYEDDDIMVINKPPNIAVHPTFSTGCDFSNSLVNFLLYHCPELREIQYNAIRSFRDSSFDDLLQHSQHIEDENDINLFYTHVQNQSLHVDVYRDGEEYWQQEDEAKEQFINSPLEDIMKPGIVHRIDKRTSGLLVIGKNTQTSRFLIEQFADHSIGREYLALTHNKLPKETWSVENYIERHPVHRTKFHVMHQPERSQFSLLTRDDVKEENIIRRKLGRMSYEEEEQMKKEVTYANLHSTAMMNQDQREMMEKLRLLEKGDVNTELLQKYQAQPPEREKKEFTVNRQKRMGTARLAVSHFRELEKFEYIPKKHRKYHRFSLLNCRLGTGRTHQVRVHCDNMKIPIIGDNLYFMKEYKKYENELFESIQDYDEMHYLHAYLLKFRHVNGKIGQFTANPPSMFTKVLGRLRTIPIMSQS